VCGEKTFRDIEGIFKKVNYIYIYIYIYMSASEYAVKREKKETKLAFQIERSIRLGEEKQIQAREISQFKSVKALAITW
jgi:hypothetical protein